jgi:hypothetical protein
MLRAGTSTFLSLVLFVQARSQDTTKFYQQDAKLFANYYEFIRSDSAQRSGTFKHKCVTDDGLVWYGEGGFREKRKKITLKYRVKPYGESIYTSTDSTTKQIRITWYDLWGNPFSSIYAYYIDTPGGATSILYESDDSCRCILVSKDEIHPQRLVIKTSSGGAVIHKLHSSTGEIRIHGNPDGVGEFHTSWEVLRKNKYGFKTIGQWTYGKKVQFGRIRG